MEIQHCATAPAGLIICDFRVCLCFCSFFSYSVQSNLGTNICLSYTNMTFKWSIAVSKYCCWLQSNTEITPKQQDKIVIIQLKFSGKTNEWMELGTEKNLLSHAHDERGEEETICTWFALDFRIPALLRPFFSGMDQVDRIKPVGYVESRRMRATKIAIGHLTHELGNCIFSPGEASQWTNIGIVWIVNFFASS